MAYTDAGSQHVDELHGTLNRFTVSIATMNTQNLK